MTGEDPTTALRRRLAETAEKELWNGSTLVGPHRDDIAFELDERDLTGFASRGQQRTAILALKLAQLELLALRSTGGHRCCCSTMSSASSTPSVVPTWCGASASCPRRS